MRFARSLCLAAVFGFFITPAASAAELTDESLSAIKMHIDEEKAVLVDVREKGEWDDGHIKGAIFLPLSRVGNGVTKDDLKALPKDKLLYVHCVVGKRAVTAGNILERHGFKVRPM